MSHSLTWIFFFLGLPSTSSSWRVLVLLTLSITSRCPLFTRPNLLAPMCFILSSIGLTGNFPLMIILILSFCRGYMSTTAPSTIDIFQVFTCLLGEVNVTLDQRPHCKTFLLSLARIFFLKWHPWGSLEFVLPYLSCWMMSWSISLFLCMINLWNYHRGTFE